MSWTLGNLANIIDGKLYGPSEFEVSNLINAGIDDPKGIAYADSVESFKQLQLSSIGVALLKNGKSLEKTPYIIVEDPKKAFITLLELKKKHLQINNGIHPTALIDTTAEIHPSAHIGPYVIISSNVKIAEKTIIHAHCFIGDNVQIAKNTILHPRVTVYNDVSIGEDSIIYAGAVLGNDGFGFQWNGKQHCKISHIGKVEIGNNVEVGANSIIVKAKCGITSIGDGTKIDDLVLIAHNVQIGQNSIVTGSTAIGGSCKIGNFVIMGGHVAIADHIKIVDGVRLGGRTGVMKDITKPGDYWGTPAKPALIELRRITLADKLPELNKKLRILENEVERISELLKLKAII